jgi:hypothetical protein
MRISWRSLVSWRTWRIAAPRLVPTSAGSRVVADVEGDEVYFESDDAQLHPSAEAFATLFFMPALKRRARLRVDAPLDPVWLRNTTQLPPIFRQWWGFTDRYPVVDSKPRDLPKRSPNRTGQCFTGGVDSFHLLMTRGDDVDFLVFVHGFDIPLTDRPRMDAFEKSLREIAERVGKKAIVLRTNLRTIRRFERAHWEYHTHGPALAATGHFLANTLGRFRIPSTWPRHDTRPYGSSWVIDGYWSSSQTAIEHGDASLSRRDKIPLVANEPLIQQHLRVCCQNVGVMRNCSRCEKCLRTMVGLERCGVLERFEVFDRSASLPELVDALPELPSNLITTWTTTCGRLQDGDLRDAVVRLLARSPA